MNEVLRTFIIVAERGSFTAAARQLGLSQPAVSMQISNLEQFFGAELLIRRAKGVAMTEAGKILLAYAYEDEKRLENLKNRINAAHEDVVGELRVVASNLPGIYLLPPLLSQFQLLHPRVTLCLETVNTRKALDSLLSKESRVVAVGELLDINQGRQFYLERDGIVLVAPAEDSRNPHSLSDLVKEEIPLVRRAAGSSTEALIEGLWKEQQLEMPHTIARVNSMSLQLELVANGLGWAFISEHALNDAATAQRVRVVPLLNLPVYRQPLLCFAEDASLTSVERAFMQFCGEKLQEKK